MQSRHGDEAILRRRQLINVSQSPFDRFSFHLHLPPAPTHISHPFNHAIDLYLPPVPSLLHDRRMHRALYVCELLRTIFDSLISDNAEKSTLSAACATTIWLEPALDSLWREIDDFKILLKLWPAEALTRDSATGSYYVRIFCLGAIISSSR